MRLYAALRPMLFILPPEWAHIMGLWGMRCGGALLPHPAPAPDNPILSIDALGCHFTNPFGMAAGFDKNAEAIHGAHKFGFGFGEVGTITPHPQFGNPRPRLFRLESERALINRMGFPSKGMDYVLRRLTKHQGAMPLGVNIGANRDSDDKIADYCEGAAAFAPLADYLVLNISSPNTPGLRNLQARDQLAALLDGVQPHLATTPLLIKLAPDLDLAQLESIVKLASERRVAGLIISNTTISRTGLAHDPHCEGGLSGAPLARPAYEMLKHAYRFTRDMPNRLTLIGAGGIMSGEDAYHRIRAGASLVQLYTGLIYEGPGLIVRAKRSLADHLKRDGFTCLADAIGVDCR